MRGKLIKVGGIRCWAGVEHVRILDVGPEDRLTCLQKASCSEFQHWAKGSNIGLRRSKVAGVNMPIGQYTEGEDDVSKDWTKCQKNQ